MQIHFAKFYSLNPNYLLISGDKALIIRVNQTISQESVLVANKDDVQGT